MAPQRKSSRALVGTKGGIGIFPVELLILILSRLPVTYLMRFKSVSKYWYGLITSLDFISLHLQRSLEASSISSLLVFRESSTWYSIEMDKLEKLDPTAKVAHPQCKGFQIVGSCNGLLCLRTLKNGASLYNPSTRALHDLPSLPYDWPKNSPEGYHISNKVNFGFGYDSVCHDYKVWRMCGFYADLSNFPFAFSGKVYSLKTNSWKEIQNFPKNIGEINSDGGVLCNETLHWVCSVRHVGRYSYDYGIIGFELHDETYREVPLPDPGIDSFYDISVGVLNKCLCTTFYPRHVDFSVWVMKEYGIKESWTRLFTINDTKLSTAWYSSNDRRPLAYSKSGDEIIVDIDGTRFLLYDLVNARIKCYLSFKHSGADICVQSLVSPKSGSRQILMEEPKKGRNYSPT